MVKTSSLFVRFKSLFVRFKSSSIIKVSWRSVVSFVIRLFLPFWWHFWVQIGILSYLEATYVGADQVLLSLRSLLNELRFVTATPAVSHFGFRPRRKHFVSSRLKYYSTNDASFQLTRIATSGDISPNPGPSSVCSICNRTIARNHRLSTAMTGLLLRVEDAHDVTKALGVFRDLEFWLGIVSRFLRHVCLLHEVKANDCKSQYHIKCVKVTPNQFKRMRTQNSTWTFSVCIWEVLTLTCSISTSSDTELDVSNHSSTAGSDIRSLARLCINKVISDRIFRYIKTSTVCRIRLRN